MLSHAVALLPVVAFLTILVLMDSFKLVPLRAVLKAIAAGIAAAMLALLVNRALLGSFPISTGGFTRYVSPPIEELLKAVYVVYLIHNERVGFLVDAAIGGFAVGTGFALLENLSYLHNLPEAGVLLWIVRGFGTALLHGGTTAILALVSMTLVERRSRRTLGIFLPGFVSATLLHSLFNHFILPPLAFTGLLLVVLPLLLVGIFERSERWTREWLGIGFDTDVEVLRLIRSPGVAQTRVGQYLHSLRSRFDGLVVADMLCLLRLQLELSIRAKGLLMAREAGLPFPLGDDVRASFRELKYLERSIGRTGLLALKPVLSRSRRDLWELYMLEAASGERSGG